MQTRTDIYSFIPQTQMRGTERLRRIALNTDDAALQDPRRTALTPYRSQAKLQLHHLKNPPRGYIHRNMYV